MINLATGEENTAERIYGDEQSRFTKAWEEMKSYPTFAPVHALGKREISQKPLPARRTTTERRLEALVLTLG